MKYTLEGFSTPVIFSPEKLALLGAFAQMQPRELNGWAKNEHPRLRATSAPSKSLLRSLGVEAAA